MGGHAAWGLGIGGPSNAVRDSQPSAGAPPGSCSYEEEFPMCQIRNCVSTRAPWGPV